VAASVYPYVTTNITGKPIEVTSAAHLESLCREHNVTHRPDAAWLTQEYKGVDWKTGKQIYKEGSGAGLPGSWIGIPALLTKTQEEIDEFFNR
jgi:hypothetical protein